MRPRFEVHFGALIPLEPGRGEIRCRVLDVSDTGALLRLEHSLLCPSQFLLKPDLGPQRICAIVWTNGRMLAVRFVEEDAPLLTGCQWATLGAIPQPI